MTNRNQKNAARTYMATHGVNYTTALRAVLAGDAPTAPYIAYGHRNYEHPDTIWERVYDLKFAINTMKGREQERAYIDYTNLREGVVYEQSNRIPAFLDILTSRVPLDTADLLHRPSMERHLHSALVQGFNDYWDEAVSDDGYSASVTIDLAAGAIEWLMASAVRPDRDSHAATYLNSHHCRVVLRALADTTLDALDAVVTVDGRLSNYASARAIADPDERTIHVLANIVEFPRRDIDLLLGPDTQ